MKYLAISLLALTVGCNTYNVERKCLPDETRQAERAKFVIKCAVAANPMSDEEGEDLVAECLDSADEIFCSRVWAVSKDGSGWHWVPCQHASQRAQYACRQAGWGRK